MKEQSSVGVMRRNSLVVALPCLALGLITKKKAYLYFIYAFDLHRNPNIEVCFFIKNKKKEGGGEKWLFVIILLCTLRKKKNPTSVRPRRSATTLYIPYVRRVIPHNRNSIKKNRCKGFPPNFRGINPKNKKKSRPAQHIRFLFDWCILYIADLTHPSETRSLKREQPKESILSRASSKCRGCKNRKT